MLLHRWLAHNHPTNCVGSVAWRAPPAASLLFLYMLVVVFSIVVYRRLSSSKKSLKRSRVGRRHRPQKREGECRPINPHWNLCPKEDRTSNPDGSYASGGVSPNMDSAGVPLDPRILRCTSGMLLIAFGVLPLLLRASALPAIDRTISRRRPESRYAKRGLRRMEAPALPGEPRRRSRRHGFRRFRCFVPVGAAHWVGPPSSRQDVNRNNFGRDRWVAPATVPTAAVPSLPPALPTAPRQRLHTALGDEGVEDVEREVRSPSSSSPMAPRPWSATWEGPSGHALDHEVDEADLEDLGEAHPARRGRA